MKALASLISCFLIIATSCKKSSTEPFNPFSGFPPRDPNNEIKAMVSIKGDPAISITVNGNWTLFMKKVKINGDTVISISGFSDKGQIEISLGHTYSIGTYTFGNNPASDQYSVCTYSIGNPLTGPFDLYTTADNNQPGTITIDNLTPGFIQGSFTANCTGTDGIIQITHGSFKGYY